MSISPEGPNPARTHRLRTIVGALAVAGLAAWVYLPVRDHAFVHFDDRSFLVENQGLAEGLTAEGIRYALTSTTDGNWIPLTWLSFQLDRELHDLSSSGTHVTNAVLHALSAAVLLVALFQLTGAVLPSAFVAAVFAVHPLHVESVAWAIERKDVLSGLWFHALLLAWAAYARRPGYGRYLVASTCLALGLLSKPMLVTAPFVLLLLDYWPLHRLQTRGERRRAVLEKLPMLAVAAVVAAITLLSQRGVGAVQDMDVLPIVVRVSNAVTSYAVYLRKAFWPSDLAVFYPHPHGLGGVSGFLVAAGAALLLGTTGLAVWQARRRPHLVVGWLWYVGMLVPVIGLVQVGFQAMADRYTYLPLTGIALALAFEAAHDLRGRRTLARAAVVCGLLAVLTLAPVARRQVDTWRDDLSLFEHAIRVEERSARGHTSLAMALLALERREEAIPHLRRALAIDGDFVSAHVNLGAALVAEGRHASAIEHLRRGLSLPDHLRWGVHANLCVALASTGRPGPAIRHFEKALAIDQPSGDAWLRLAMELNDAGRWQEARRALERAERKGVDVPERHLLGAQLEERAGRSPAAVARYRRLVAARPDSLVALNNLAWLLATDPAVAQPAQAVEFAEQAAQLPGGEQPTVLDTLAVAYAAAGRPDEAARTATRAARLAREQGDEELARTIERRSAGP